MRPEPRIVLAVCLGTLLSIPARAGEAPKPAFTNQMDKVSYSVGMSLANLVKRYNFDVNPDLVGQGFKDVMTGHETRISDQEMQETMRTYQNELRAKREEARMKLAEKNHKEGEAFLAENQKKPGVMLHDIKLADNSVAVYQSRIVTEGTGEVPKAGDVVSFSFRGTLINGTEYDSTAKHGGQPIRGVLNNIVPQGARDALALMKVGSKWQLFLPSALAYGDYPNGIVEPGSTVIYEVELLGVETPQPLVSDIVKVPSKEEFDKGAKVEIIKAEDLKKLQTNSAAGRKP